MRGKHCHPLLSTALDVRQTEKLRTFRTAECMFSSSTECFQSGPNAFSFADLLSTSQCSCESSHFLCTPPVWILWLHTDIAGTFHVLVPLLTSFSFPPRNALWEGQITKPRAPLVGNFFLVGWSPCFTVLKFARWAWHLGRPWKGMFVQLFSHKLYLSRQGVSRETNTTFLRSWGHFKISTIHKQCRVVFENLGHLSVAWTCNDFKLSILVCLHDHVHGPLVPHIDVSLLDWSLPVFSCNNISIHSTILNTNMYSFNYLS